MVDLAMPMVTARKAPRASEQDRWIGAGRALAGEIWGINYAGTVPSYGVPVSTPSNVFPEHFSHPGSMYVTVSAGPTTPVVWPPNLEDLYWRAFRPMTSEIGVAVWEDECVISLPARMTPPAPDMLFWTSEGVGASSILIVAEAKLSRTDPADASHAPAWRRIFEARSTLQRPTAEQLVVTRDVYSELRMLVEWTRLPVEQFGELLGASRRTMYNWLAGRPIRDEAQARILRLRDAIAEIAASRDPALVRAWLIRGDPSPATLAAEERWNEFEGRVRDEASPLRPIDQTPEEGRESRADSPEVLKAALVVFSTARDRTTTRRSVWSPREITGIASGEEEAE